MELIPGVGRANGEGLGLPQGLEAQLLGIVVRKERPELEEQKDTLVLNIAAGKRRLQELEDEILRWGCVHLWSGPWLGVTGTPWTIGRCSQLLGGP